MNSQIKLGRIAGIEIGLNYSWFIVAFLIALSLVDHFHTVSPAWPGGLVTAEEVRAIPRDDWSQTSVQAVMRHLDEIPSVPPQMAAIEALERMQRGRQALLTVLSQGRFQGIFSQGQVIRFLNLTPHGAGQSHHRKAA